MSSISAKHEESGPLTVTAGAKKIFQSIYWDQNRHDSAGEDIPRLQVSDVISKMSFYYEKIRNAVNYTEEHLVRKDAIFRILKRQLVIEGSVRLVRADDSVSIARHLLIELIRGGYLPNNSLPEIKVDEVAEIIGKYTTLRAIVITQTSSRFNFFSAAKENGFESRSELNNWLFGLAASEIEEHIGRNQVAKTTVNVMYGLLEKRIELPASLPYERDLPIQIYIAIYRHFLQFDDEMLSLILVRYFNADWSKPTAASLRKVAHGLPILKRVIDAQLVHPIAGQLKRVVAAYTVYFKILEDVIRENPVEVYDSLTEDPKSFPRRIKRVCSKRYGQAKGKLWRAAWRSIIYILLTKSVFAIALEVPATKFLGENINPASLAVNVGFPAMLLFLAVAITRLPADDNTNRIVSGIEEILFTEKRKADPIKLRKPIGRHPVMNVIFGFIYIITFCISFGGVIWLLDVSHFSWVSIIIFLFFLAFVSFFIVRIRRIAKQWIVVPPRDSLMRFAVDFFSVPIIATGKWLSGKFSRLNIFAFILDFIIEAPFKIIVEVADQWTRYVRERKEDL